ncbi:class F sortase [Candidatus Saccharibacteria bacterium]|nr:class F sortase [Candidatus Saccharibacteria bacterium]
MTFAKFRKNYSHFALLITPFLLTSLLLASIPSIIKSMNGRNNIDVLATTSTYPEEFTELERITPNPEPEKTEEVATEPEPEVEQTSGARTIGVTVVANPETPAPQLPVVHSIGRIIIDSIGLSAIIEEVGTTNNKIDVPAHNVGWFNQSAGLGSPSGTSFLDGHSDGIFHSLHRVEIGQIIQIESGGNIHRYQVEQKYVTDLIGLSMLPILNHYRFPSRGISLMTCYGHFVPSLGTFNQRLIIYARLV